MIMDVNDGSCYMNAYTYYCSNKEKDVVCPLILFIDKTHTDTKGSLTLEPVCLTLGIFNKTTRNKEEAWRIIGFIPNLDGVSKKKDF
jgi:Plavaka transposase